MPERPTASERTVQAPSNVSSNALQLFSANVRRHRLDARLSQEALAARCGKYKNQIAQIEDGTANVTLSMVFVLASALGVDAAELLQDPPAVSLQDH